MKKETKFIIGGAIVLIIVLVGLGRMNQSADASTWMDTDIECLPFGHQSLALHIHPNIYITVDGTTEAVPGNIGLTDTCMAEVHTHDATGKVHIESTDRSRTFTLGDFFEVWGEPVVREGYDVRVHVNGEPTEENLEDIRLRDLQEIEVIYTSLSQESNESESTEESTTTSETEE